ncbi:MAG: amidohydrolase [Bacteroidales bacterium]|nr:amidohydrolase [Bacteroidales bacterium]
MTISKGTIARYTEDFFPEILQTRKYLHKNPELSFEEYKTAQFIKTELKELEIEFSDGYVKTGIVGIIKGKNPGKKTVALRADIDALPIQELNETDYKSKIPGVMHACGHDVHTSSLLGTAKILQHLKDQFEGTVLLVFQPGEEKLPGGAKLMLEAGALKNPKPDIIIGQHVMPGLQSGKVGFRQGMYMASTDEIYLTVKGKGGHAAMPHQVTDSVLIASHIIVALQQIVSRNAIPFIPTVLSFGKVEAKGATNIIPAEVKVEGTFRTMDETWRKEAHKKIKAICESVSTAMGASCDIEIKPGYPFLINDDEITKKAKTYAEDILGKNEVVDLDLRMTAEDFAYYSQQFPSTFYRLGITDKKGKNSHPLHSPYFDIDEEALKTGMKLMAWLAVSFLNET